MKSINKSVKVYVIVQKRLPATTREDSFERQKYSVQLMSIQTRKNRIAIEQKDARNQAVLQQNNKQ